MRWLAVGGAVVCGVGAFLLWREARRYQGFWDDDRSVPAESGVRGWDPDPPQEQPPSERLMRGNAPRFGSAA